MTVLAERFAIVKLDPRSDVPDWAHKGAFVSVTRTPDELSIVCSAQVVPADVRFEGPFCGIKVCGPLEFAETGVLASIALPLSQAGVSLFAVSTFETDYVLVGQADLRNALQALGSVGHKISEIDRSDSAAPSSREF